MTSDASKGLHRAILKALNKSTRIGELLGAGGRICGEDMPQDTDHPDDQGRPSIILRSGTARSWHSATFDGQEHALVLDVFCKRRGPDTQEISSAIIERLHDADLPINGHALVSLDFECSETTAAEDPGDGIDQCRLYFKALTIGD